MWNQHTYDVGTLTKEKRKSEINGKQSWAYIVNRTPKQNSYPHTINPSQSSSLSSLSHNNYKPRKKKKNKMNEYIKTTEHRLNKNAPQKKNTNNKSRPTRQNKKAQLGSESTSGENCNKNSKKNFSSPKDIEPKRLKIFINQVQLEHKRRVPTVPASELYNYVNIPPSKQPINQQG